MRPSTHARGYTAAHQRRRKQAARQVNAGHATCWRCGLPIHPTEPWDLGHNDRDKTITMGPEHQACNRAVNTHKPPRNRPQHQHPGLTTNNTPTKNIISPGHPGEGPKPQTPQRPSG